MSVAATAARALRGRGLPTLVLLAAAASATAQAPVFTPQPDLPIDLDAASSEFDRRNSRLVFQRVQITQGPLRVTAAVAEATRLDFENSRWLFRGDVVIENGAARVSCNEAELQFMGHQLRTARLVGEPARFEQQRSGRDPTQGRAGVIDYDVVASTVLLSRDAWLSDGANEVSGERISYDLRREYVTADAAGKGRVRMRINPPAREPQDGTPP